MGKSYGERRRYRIGDFEFLLDDDDRTAWIDEGNSGGVNVYTMPERVSIEGEEYTVTSVEAGAYNTSQDAFLEEIWFPDCYEYFDEYAFCNSPVKKIHLGKGFKGYMYWTLKSASPDLEVEIDPGNPYIKISDDGHMVLTRDGKELVYLIHDVSEIVVPEGVSSIAGCAISCKHKLKRIQLPSTLENIAVDGIIENRELESLIVPEGVTKIGHQAFFGDWGMTLLDLPSSVTELDWDTFLEDMNLLRLVMRCPQLVEVDAKGVNCQERIPWNTCHLAVPQHLIPEYRKHPYWGCFKYIECSGIANSTPMRLNPVNTSPA